jgi:Transmembrane exosortase (Exosortase_EpsH).
MSPTLRTHAGFAVFVLISGAVFSPFLRQLISLSLDDGRYSHIILVPVISAFVLFLGRRRIFSGATFCPKLGLPLVVAALALYALLALGVVPSAPEYRLSLAMLAIVLAWAGGFALCYGAHAFGSAFFPLGLLLLTVPVPSPWMDKVIALLQWGSAEATYWLFLLVGQPVFRDGVRFELPGVGIEIAKECSSIHSAWALLITGMLVAHLFLKSLWAKVSLTLLTVPIAMLTNAVRIVTIWELATRVDPGFLYGNLHRNGGILFSLISLSILVGFMAMLRRLETRRQSVASAASLD